MFWFFVALALLIVVLSIVIAVGRESEEGRR